jgi:hypothetical protein
MALLTQASAVILWQDLIKHAEDRCDIELKEDLEAYLVSLLMRYTNQPNVHDRVLAIAFLEALQKEKHERQFSLQVLGDECLLFAGLFPHLAEKRRVKISYFVNLGRSAYGAVSKKANDLYHSLAMQFVVLMDVLQSIRPHTELLPLQAYEQWEELGSRRALQILQELTRGTPHKKY